MLVRREAPGTRVVNAGEKGSSRDKGCAPATCPARRSIGSACGASSSRCRSFSRSRRCYCGSSRRPAGRHGVPSPGLGDSARSHPAAQTITGWRDNRITASWDNRILFNGSI